MKKSVFSEPLESSGFPDDKFAGEDIAITCSVQNIDKC